jgi:hypothetical protein
MQLENGTYQARPLAGEWASVYETEGGALMLAMKFQLADGQLISAWVCLAGGQDSKNPGMVLENAVKSLREWSGWDGADPTWFMEVDLSGVDVDLVIENEVWQGKASPKVKWINKPGSGGGAKLPETDRRAIAAKYGAKFRALAGGVPPKPRPAGQMAPPPSAPPTRPAPAPAKPVATQASAWAKLNTLGAGTADLEALWFRFVDATGMDQAEMTLEGWAQVETAIEQHFNAEGLPF